MKKRDLKAKFLTSALTVALAASLIPASAFAARGDVEGGTGTEGSTDTEGGRPGGGSTVSDSVLTVPEGLENGVYSGTATVQQDEDEDFTNYTIRVSAEVTDGAITNVYVSGAGGNNLSYSNDALAGILKQVTGLTAGNADMDMVSGATCSSKAIVQGLNTALQGTPSLTTYSVNNGISNVTYLPDGSTFTVTITNPVEGVNYADIGLQYGVGKFAGDLVLGDDYSVTRLEATDNSVTYQITINKDSKYVINDDDLIHSELYNEPGRQLTLTVAEQGLGTIYIKSTAELSIANNTISLTGGNGETLSDFLALIDEVKVQYEDENGEEVSKTYTTQWQHDMEPAFLGSDLFSEDGSINFDVVAEVTKQGDDFEAEKDEEGNNITYSENVFPYGADGDYYITVTSGGGYDEVSGYVGVKNGLADSRAEDGNWYYYTDGKIDAAYTGFATNKNGSWYVTKGKVSFKNNSVIKDETGAIGKKNTWYYVTGSKVQTKFTGLADYPNENGWWYIKNGKVDFSANTVAKNKNGWWYVTGGKVRFDFNGLANYPNKNGWWYIKNGKVDFSANTVAKNKNGWWYITGGKVQFDFNGLANYPNKNGWWYIKNGKVDFSYAGLAQNKNGTWYLKNGKVDFSFNGKVTNNGKTYTVKNGKVR